MKWTQKVLIPFLCALVTAPAFIVLHEFGHYVAALCLGLDPKLHFAKVDVVIHQSHLPTQVDAIFASGGPLIGALMALLGYLWLRNLRVARIDSNPTICDWLATCLAMNVARWIRGFACTPSYPQPDDEALLSRTIGLPQWALPYVLGVLAIVVVTLIVRLHPPGNRLQSFMSFLIGTITGCVIWMKLIGPLIFA
jgi:hypothetical protein